MIDPTATLLAYLATVTPLTNIVATRLYGPPGLPVGYAGATSALVIMLDASNEDTSTPIIDQPFQARCYGSTPTTAYSVFAALHDAIHNIGPLRVTVSGSTVLLARGRLLSGPVFMTEPELNFGFWLARYGAILSDRTVT